MKYVVKLQFPTTNNEAKYEASLIGLKLARIVVAKDVIVQADSQLVIGQVKGEYEVKEERMQKYLKLVQLLLPYFDDIDFQQITRTKNMEANFWARLALSVDQTTPIILFLKEG